MCTKLPLDCTRKWCRTAESVQTHQNHVENQIYSTWWWTKGTGERMVNRNRWLQVSHPSYSFWEQKCDDREFSRTFSVTAQLRSSRFWIFSENREESQIAEPLCSNGTTLKNVPDAPMKINKRKLWKADQETQWLLFIRHCANLDQWIASWKCWTYDFLWFLGDRNWEQLKYAKFGI